MNRIVEFIKNMFRKKKKVDNVANVDIEYHPEILFLINHPYAEYVDYEETN